MSMRLVGPLADRTLWRADACSIAKAMDVIGSRPVMLLLREAFYGTTRFDDFATRVGVSDAVASARLKQLVDLEIFEKRPYRQPGQRTRHEYLLTPKGEGLLPAVLALMQWGDAHLQEDGGPLNLVEEMTGAPVVVQVVGAEGNVLGVDDIAVAANPARIRAGE